MCTVTVLFLETVTRVCTIRDSHYSVHREGGYVHSHPGGDCAHERCCAQRHLLVVALESLGGEEMKVLKVRRNMETMRMI